MSEFIPYQHVEKWGNVEVEGIHLGEVFVFPKMDGTNASAWMRQGDGDSISFAAGSRHRELSIESDNAGFCKHVIDSDEGTKLRDYLHNHPSHMVYGEWLVPHTLKTYRDDAWRRFWIFDVFNRTTGQLIHYNNYAPELANYSLDFIPPLGIIKNGNYDNFVHLLEANNFFIKDGQGLGEGIVLKNYEFYNRFGNQKWAKIIRSEFKEQHHRVMGPPETEAKLIEEAIAEEFCTEALVQKTYAKIALDGWNSKKIPELLERVYYDVVTEEIWNILKKHRKTITINFGTLRHFVTRRVKAILPEVFS